MSDSTEVVEVWKDVVGYEGIYHISSLGRLKSLKRVKFCGPCNRVCQEMPERILPGTPDKDGYLHTLLHKNGSRKRIAIHRLVLEAFRGPCPEGMEACHFPDNNPANNKLDNLCWNTKKKNQRDRLFHGTDMNGEKHWRAAVTNEVAEEMRKVYSTGKHTQTDIARMFGVTKIVARMIVLNKTYRKVVSLPEK